MQPKSPKLLEDIRDAAEFIREAAQGLTLDDYRDDRRLRNAVERNFEIIGEAMKRLAQIDQETADRIGDSIQIIAFRNVLIHGYDRIADTQVWHVITHDLSPLERQVSELLREAK